MYTFHMIRNFDCSFVKLFLHKIFKGLVLL